MILLSLEVYPLGQTSHKFFALLLINPLVKIVYYTSVHLLQLTGPPKLEFSIKKEWSWNTFFSFILGPFENDKLTVYSPFIRSIDFE